jgi:predicted secreted protein
MPGAGRVHRQPHRHAARAGADGGGERRRTQHRGRARTKGLRLEANRAEGYRWSVATSGNALAQLGEPFYTQEKSVAGGGGAEYWSFMPVRSGKQELRFEYRRTWEIDKPAAKVLNYTVSVRQ